MAGENVLVIHPGALGDVLQAVPALRALGALGGGSRVTLAAQPRLARLLSGTRVVDAGLPFDGLGLEHLFVHDAVPESLRTRIASFDRVVSWFGAHTPPYPDHLRSLIDATIVAPPVPDEDSALAVWEHLLATLGDWGVKGPPQRAPLAPPTDWSAAAAATLAELGCQPGRPLLVVHPGAGGAAKRWPVEKHAAVVTNVAARSGCRVLVHQGPADRAPAGDLLAAIERRGVEVLTLLEPDLGLLAAVLHSATAYLGADSGVSHLAAAMGVSAVIVFPTETRQRWAPWSPTARPLTMTPDGRDTEEATRLFVSPTARA